MPIILALLVFYSCGSRNIYQEISIDNMKRVTEIMSSDSFAGRKPFTIGEKKSVEFLENELKSIGFEPLFGDSYFQKVPMIQTTSVAISPALIAKGAQKIFTYDVPNDFALSSPRRDEIIELKNSPIIFCGFGIDAPELGWNDFEGIDVKGKTIVVLINDPGLYTKDKNLFKGEEMTYFGRWTYKYEEAARKGADAVLIIHEEKGAGYGFNVPRNSAITSRLSIDDPNLPLGCKVTGWINAITAEKLFSSIGKNVDSLRKEACKKGFKPFDTGLKISVKIKNKITKDSSVNVGGVLRGSELPEESLIITAHWDHFGIGEPQDGDSIYNGAVDNCTTIAWALEIGRNISKQPSKQKRSLVLLFPTAEEQGLTGSEYYASHPTLPIEKTIACLNNDMMVPRGEMNDVTIIGYGYSKLDSLYEVHAKQQGRYIMPDPASHSGLFFRSDHFPFYKRGVPSVWAMGCYDSKNNGKEWADSTWKDYVKNKYHRPSDNYNPNWDWGGVVQDAQLALKVSLELLNNPKINLKK